MSCFSDSNLFTFIAAENISDNYRRFIFESTTTLFKLQIYRSTNS